MAHGLMKEQKCVRSCLRCFFFLSPADKFVSASQISYETLTKTDKCGGEREMTAVTGEECRWRSKFMPVLVLGEGMTYLIFTLCLSL